VIEDPSSEPGQHSTGVQVTPTDSREWIDRLYDDTFLRFSRLR
jgi:hypothetical protein